MTAFFMAGGIAVGSLLWFLRADEVREHGSVAALACGLALASVVALSHFVGW